MPTDHTLFSTAFTYNATTGNLHRKGSPIPITGKQVRHNGTDYWVNRVVWLLNTGDWPTGNLKHVDGNKKNTFINNLRLASQEAQPLDAPHLELTPQTADSAELVALKGQFIAADAKLKHYTTQLEQRYGMDWETELSVKSLAGSAAMGQMILRRNELEAEIDRLEGRVPALCGYAGYAHFKFPCIDNECRTMDKWLSFVKTCQFLKLIPGYDKEVEGFTLFAHGMYIPQNIYPLAYEAYVADVMARRSVMSPSVQTAKMKLQEEESLRNPNPEIKWLESQLWASQLEEHRARLEDYKKHNPVTTAPRAPMTREQVALHQGVEEYIDKFLLASS